tara:strand:+ start:336 stop:554 length:219 start_codon:yes stop_codon:yes gene_type:complete
MKYNEFEHNIGDLVRWSWCLGYGWERTSFLGVIVSSHMHRGHGKVRIFSVVDTDGDIVNIRADDGTLEAACK